MERATADRPVSRDRAAPWARAVPGVPARDRAPDRTAAKPTAAPHHLDAPTLLLAAIIYGGWLALTWWHDRLPWWLVSGLGAWLVAWHGSLQHETIHGHPTGRAAIDAAIGGVPLSLWLPYAVYRHTHILHHATDAVTDPFEDPESRYLAPAVGAGGAILHAIEQLQATLAGRLLFGPAITITRFLFGEGARLRAAPRQLIRDWLPHLGAAVLVVGWLRLCGFGLGGYLFGIVYPATALSLLRSYAEHRADPRPERRVAIVERAGPFALLFLHNNLHAVHHAMPGLAWYRLPAAYRAHRGRLLAGHCGPVYAGYGDVARRYLFRRHDRLVHPAHAGGGGRR